MLAAGRPRKTGFPQWNPCFGEMLEQKNNLLQEAMMKSDII